MSAINAWVHQHPWTVIAMVACIAATLGILLMAALVSGRDPADEREAERRAGHW